MKLVREHINEAIKHLTGFSGNEVINNLEIDPLIKKYLIDNGWNLEDESEEIYYFTHKDFNYWLEVNSSDSFEKFIEINRINEAVKHLSGRSDEELFSNVPKEFEELFMQIYDWVKLFKPYFDSEEKCIVVPQLGMFTYKIFEGINTYKNFKAYKTWFNDRGNKSLDWKHCKWDVYAYGKNDEHVYSFYCKDFEEFKAEVRSKHSKNFTTIHESIKHLSPRSEEEIKREVLNYSPYDKIKLASKKGLLWLLKDVIEKENAHNYLDTALVWASQEGQTEIVKYLLNFPESNPADLSSVSIRSAIYYRHADVVKLLLKDGRADPTDNDLEIIKDIAYNTEAKTSKPIIDMLMRDKRFSTAYFKFIKSKKFKNHTNYRSDSDTYEM